MQGLSLTPTDLIHSDLDHRLAQVGKSVRVLSELTAGAAAQEKFLAAFRAGNPIPPELPTPTSTFASEEAELTDIIAKCDQLSPIGSFIANRAQSYLDAIFLLRSAHTPDFLHYSFRLYGHPLDPFPGEPQTILQAAQNFQDQIDPFLLAAQNQAPEQLISAEELADRIQSVSDRLLGDKTVDVVIDDDLSAKAAASASRIRVRRNALFTKYDIPQLVNHELLVHALTSINGQAQPIFPSLGLGAPNTTQTQEGLAVYSELATNCMDLMRLRRIALRVVAIYMALEGGDFMDVLNFFLESGYDESESVYSTFRIFRGCDPSGGTAFTKDIIYLGGLISVQNYLRTAVSEGRHDAVDLLFVGRMSIDDLPNLESYFERGLISPPQYRPTWAQDFPTLATRIILTAPRYAPELMQ